MNKLFFILLGILCASALYILAPILTPFLFAGILAYLSDPLVNKLMKLHLPRLVSVIIVFLILFLFLVLLIVLSIPVIENQLVILGSVLPNTASWFQNTIVPIFKDYLGTSEVIDMDTLKTTLAENWMKAGGIATWIGKSALKSGFAVAEWLVTLVLIPVVTFYLLRDWDRLIVGIRALLPRKLEPTVVKLVKECDDVLSAFFRGQLLVMLSLGIIYSIGLSLVGLQVGLMIGIMAGLFSIVPYLGLITGITVASIVAFIQFGTFSKLLLVWLVFLIGQLTESMFLTPKLVGDRIGLHPVAVIFSVLTGGTLFGFFGVLLALPVAAVIMVLMRFINRQYRESTLYQ